MLSNDIFKIVIKHNSLFAIDLIVKNEENKVLLGLRNNAPAKGYWFVPGGRVFKNETMVNAFRRIAKDEVNIDIDSGYLNLRFYGLYDHIYEDNFFNEPGYNTHYIVAACEINIKGYSISKHDSQHDYLKFIGEKEIISLESVHKFTKNYFIKNPDNVFLKCQ